MEQQIAERSPRSIDSIHEAAFIEYAKYCSGVLEWCENVGMPEFIFLPSIGEARTQGVNSLYRHPVVSELLASQEDVVIISESGSGKTVLSERVLYAGMIEEDGRKILPVAMQIRSAVYDIFKEIDSALSGFLSVYLFYDPARWNFLSDAEKDRIWPVFENMLGDQRMRSIIGNLEDIVQFHESGELRHISQLLQTAQEKDIHYNELEILLKDFDSRRYDVVSGLNEVIQVLGFEEIYLIIEVHPGTTSLLDLFDSIAPFRETGMRIKIFWPEEHANQLSDLEIGTCRLEWSPKQLEELVELAVKSDSDQGQGFESFCHLSVINSLQIVSHYCATPREMIEALRRVVIQHVEISGTSGLLTLADFTQALPEVNFKE
jgi:hypothetical protein